MSELRLPQLPHPRPIEPGSRVAVLSTYDGDWCRGFSVAEVVVEGDLVGYRLSRHSDGSVLPAVFPAEDVIPDHR
jgi:hypothetical protein